MKKIILSAAVLLCLAACKKTEEKTTETTTMPKDSTTVVKDETPAAPMDSVTMMKKWDEYKTPGDMHKMLADESGMWTTESTMWMSANDPKPQKSSGTADVKMILGGRYQQGMHKGMVWGQPFEGISTVGYDNASKKYVSTWQDNMGTGIMYMTGDYDAATKMTTFKGMCTDPMTGKEKPCRETWSVVDNNTRKMEMFDIGADGKEYKCMEMSMMRKK